VTWLRIQDSATMQFCTTAAVVGVARYQQCTWHEFPVLVSNPCCLTSGLLLIAIAFCTAALPPQFCRITSSNAPAPPPALLSAALPAC
jgi:hypothetical protein